MTLDQSVFAQEKQPNPFWINISETETLFGLTDYIEGYKDIDIAGSVWGIWDGEHYTAGFIIELVREKGRERTVRCTWGDAAKLHEAMKKIKAPILPEESTPTCGPLSRTTGAGKLNYRQIAEDWLAVVKHLKTFGGLPEAK